MSLAIPRHRTPSSLCLARMRGSVAAAAKRSHCSALFKYNAERDIGCSHLKAGAQSRLSVTDASHGPLPAIENNTRRTNLVPSERAHGLRFSDDTGTQSLGVYDAIA